MVEIVLFCPFYQDSMWELSPLNPRNNVNGLGAGITRQSAYDLGWLDPAVVSFMDTYVRKIVTEVNGFDNLYFELVNEPYSFDDIVPDRFQRHVADLIVATEKTLPKQHLIAQNIANGSRKIDNPHPAVSIFNFHYASPPDAVTVNYALGKVIGDDETGFRGQADLPYRVEAWNFLVAGGGIFSHLDYSYTTAHPAGTWMPLPPNQPGGGGPEFRRQMRILADFMNGFAFVRMAPRADVVSICRRRRGSHRTRARRGRAAVRDLRVVRRYRPWQGRRSDACAGDGDAARAPRGRGGHAAAGPLRRDVGESAERRTCRARAHRSRRRHAHAAIAGVHR